ncbi:hypothetical protein L218DRAFT_508850 [Marasmius fiardii PR-910]|nr:hypothetical protein L218DRAFT_508850 [Marasmius fiardii PR-910]
MAAPGAEQSYVDLTTVQFEEDRQRPQGTPGLPNTAVYRNLCCRANDASETSKQGVEYPQNGTKFTVFKYIYYEKAKARVQQSDVNPILTGTRSIELHCKAVGQATSGDLQIDENPSPVDVALKHISVGIIRERVQFQLWCRTCSNLFHTSSYDCSAMLRAFPPNTSNSQPTAFRIFAHPIR